MIVIVENISDRAMNRLMKNPLGDKVVWIGIREKGEVDVCLDDDRYSIFTGRLFDKREYVEIKHEEHAFVVMTGEFDRVIVE